MVSEADLTSPTERCPHPERWTTEDGMSTENEVAMLIGAFVRAIQPNFVLEIGSSKGVTTQRLAAVARDYPHIAVVSLEIDPDTAAEARYRCAGLPVLIETTDSLSYTPPQPIDFLFVDGAPDRLADIRHFKPYLARGAWVFVHDTAKEPYSQSVDTILDTLSHTAVELNTPRGLLIIQMPD